MEIPLLTDIAKLFGLSVAVLLVCSRLRIPTLVGFLVTGVIAGPHGIGVVANIEGVEAMAEIGVVLLLFTIGLEFSIQEFIRIRKPVLLGGAVQMFFLLALGLSFALLTEMSVAQSIFYSFLLALSSTAIALRLIQERAEIDTPHGRSSLGILIFQDVAVVPMMLLLPVLAGAAGGEGESLGSMAKGLLGVAVVAVGAKWAVPRLLDQIARTRNRELFLLSVVGLCFGIAWATNQAGLSLALGAFLAGLIISESQYSHQALGNILPFRDVFSAFFFVSIGMLLDVGVIFDRPFLVGSLTLGVLVLKTTAGALATFALGYPLRTMLLVGFAISQIGEFSFVLAETGYALNLIDPASYQLFLAVTVLTMAATPIMFLIAPKAVDAISSLPLPERLRSGVSPSGEDKRSRKRDHVVIVGFGINGRNLARAARAGDIEYEIIEMNADVVRHERKAGEPIWYGDASHPTVLEHVNIHEAKIAVVAVSDPIATRKITAAIHEINPRLHLIVRTRYVQELKPLYALGASRVIPEEFETSIQIFSSVLREYGLPRGMINLLIEEARSGNYELFRTYHENSATEESAHEDET